jgi:hypothetical protein
MKAEHIRRSNESKKNQNKCLADRKENSSENEDWTDL